MTVLGVRALTVAALVVTALAPVASVAGGYAPLAAAVALVLALLGAPVPRRPEAVWPVVLVHAAAAGMLARVLGAYLVPDRTLGLVTAVLAVLVAAVLVGARVGCPPVVWWLVAGFAVLALVLLAGAAYGVAPAPNPAGHLDPAVALPGGLLVLGCAAGLHPPEAAGRRTAVLLGACAAVLFAGLALLGTHQLGGPRMGLSPAPLVEVLYAADAGRLVPVLVAAVGLLCAVATLASLTWAATAAAAWRVRWPVAVAVPAAVAVAAALVAAVWPLLGATLLAALVVVRWAHGLRRPPDRSDSG